MVGSVTAVVLAAGASERMGEPKLLLPLRGMTVLNTTLAAVEASRADRVIVVTGANAESVEGSIDAARATITQNPDYRRGNMSSFLTAVAADPDADAFIVVPGDMPEIRTEVIDAMVELWADQAPWAEVTAYADRIAHPILASRGAVNELTGASGEKVLGRLLIESPDERVVRVDVPYDAPRDVNTPGDYTGLTGA
jgi:molybdenum cofactor cytidylyltransferase